MSARDDLMALAARFPELKDLSVQVERLALDVAAGIDPASYLEHYKALRQAWHIRQETFTSYRMKWEEADKLKRVMDRILADMRPKG